MSCTMQNNHIRNVCLEAQVLLISIVMGQRVNIGGLTVMKNVAVDE